MFAGSDRGLWLVQQRQSELIHDAAQQRLVRYVPERVRQTRGTDLGRTMDLFGAIAFSQGRRLAAVRQIVAPDPCPDCADCPC